MILMVFEFSPLSIFKIKFKNPKQTDLGRVVGPAPHIKS
jgi:hypothetical protein